MPKSTFLRNRVLDCVFNGATLSVATAYASLHAADPGLTGASEIAAGANAYARQAVSMGPASAGALASDAVLTWANTPDVTITHVGVWDAATGGNFLYSLPLSPPTTTKNLDPGDTFTIPVSNLNVSES